MSVYAELADGRKLEFPDGTAQDVIHSTVKKVMGVGVKGEDTMEAPDPTGSVAQNLAAGAGRALHQAGLGMRQIGSYVPGLNRLPGFRAEGVAADIAEAKRLEAPLMNTISGQAGDVLGNLGMMLGIPGAGTYKGAAGAGGVIGGVQPVSPGESRATNVGTGAAAGIAGKGAGDLLAKGLSKVVQSKGAKLAIKEGQDQVKNEALAIAKQEGFHIPPASANRTVVNETLEGISGKIKTAQTASEHNQGKINNLARRDVGLPADAAITDDALDAVRRQAGKAYDTIKSSPNRFQSDKQFADELTALGSDFSAAAQEFPEIAGNAAISTLQKALNKPDMSPTAAVELVKKLRFDANKNFKAFDDPAKAHLAKAQRGAADAIEGLIERNLATTAPDALANFQAARQLIAKTYDIEDALVAGNVDARKLAAKLTAGKPLTGELEKIAKVAASFPKATQHLDQPAGQISPIDIFAGFGTSIAAGHPGPMALVWGRPAVRNVLLSKPYQAVMTTPSYNVNPLLTGASGIAGNALVRRVTPGIASGAALNGNQ